MAGLPEVWRYLLADNVPNNPRTGPISNRRNRVMRKVARNGQVAFIDSITTSSLQPRDEVGIAIGLSIIFIARIERSGPERDAQNVIGALRLVGVLSAGCRKQHCSRGGRQHLAPRGLHR